jgi:hypothetical protein
VRLLSTSAVPSTVNCQQKVHAAHQVLYGNLEQFQVSKEHDSLACAVLQLAGWDLPCLQHVHACSYA